MHFTFNIYVTFYVTLMYIMYKILIILYYHDIYVVYFNILNSSSKKAYTYVLSLKKIRNEN